MADVVVNRITPVATLGRTRWTSWAALVFACMACLGFKHASAIGPNAGKWGPVIKFPVIPVAAAVLPTNKLLVWSANYKDAFLLRGEQVTQFAIMDLATGKVSPLRSSVTDQNMFCPGVVQMYDGRIAVTGGSNTQKTSFFNPWTGRWAAGAPMSMKRGYNGAVTLSNGRVFTVGGGWGLRDALRLAEVWAAGQGWTLLDGIDPTTFYLKNPAGSATADHYPWFFAMANGEVFQAGPSRQMNFYTTAGRGGSRRALWTPQGGREPTNYRGNDQDSIYGNAVMYAPYRVLTIGGAPSMTAGANATSNVHHIVLRRGSPSAVVKVEELQPMKFKRVFHNSVVLPNGDVITFGGQPVAYPFTDIGGVLTPELWSRTTRTWRSLRKAAVARNYHSVAILLPNGRVFSGGGGLCNSAVNSWCSPLAKNHLDGQIYTPPYLLEADGKTRAVRPKIRIAPSAAKHNQKVVVVTNQPATFVLIRLSAVTHSANTDQRRIPLRVLSSKSAPYLYRYVLRIPADPGVAIPGYYYLFALNKNGVPSMARFVRITAL